jgi:predicted exporter
VHNAGGWAVMLPLRGVAQPDAIADTIAGGDAVFLDLKHESDALYRSYLREAITHALIGAVAITLLLFAALRSPRRVFTVLAPLVAAVIVTAALLATAGFRLTIFHLVGLLLVVAVGSNYALFFDRRVAGAVDRERTAVSLLFANLTTMLGFGLLAFSKVPVLQALGATVGLGAVLALVFSALLHRPSAGEH